MLDFIDPIKKEGIIKGAVIYPLKVYRDSRGILVETLKETWQEVYSKERPFTQNYFSMTMPGVARDEDLWHVHPTKQEDRFVVISGDLVLVLADYRKESPTFGKMNLFKMGEGNGDNGQFLVLIPKNVLHGFLVISNKPAVLLNFPTTIYDSNEEGRIPYNKIKATLADGRAFSWELVRKELSI